MKELGRSEIESRVLEEKEVMRIGSDYVIPLDVRVLAAANEGLKAKVRAGNFRKDLFYRLNILEIHIPPLRNRKMDIMPLFNHYLGEACGGTQRDGGVRAEAVGVNLEARLDSASEERLLAYDWPGNVRELKNIVQRYVLYGEIDLDDGDNSPEEDVWEGYEREVNGHGGLGRGVSGSGELDAE
ncbi:MAG: sigma 54-interacting transcriptional regulator [Clostridiales bacterium]|nr:sigma 54-interacting transcriptional regulator [Clostridiales bacterium]